MARASSVAENAALAGVDADALYLSIHSSDPGTTGASELSGGSYARVSVTWGSPTGGTVSNTNALTVNIPNGATAAFFGLWSAVTGGNYVIGGQLSSSQTFNTAGTLSIAAGGLTVSAS